MLYFNIFSLDFILNQGVFYFCNKFIFSFDSIKKRIFYTLSFIYALIIINLAKMLRFVNTLPLFRYGLKASWANAEVHRPFDGKVQNVTLIPGIGIGP